MMIYNNTRTGAHIAIDTPRVTPEMIAEAEKAPGKRLVLGYHNLTDDVSALADAASMALTDQKEYFRSGGMALDYHAQELENKAAWLCRIGVALAKLGQAHLAAGYATLAGMIDASQIKSVPLADVAPKPFALVNLDTNDAPTGFDTLDEARGGAAFDRMTHYEIWEGDDIRESVDTTPGPKCTACGRGESICSRNPCAAVVTDREA